MHVIACNYMLEHVITCNYMHVIACNYMQDLVITWSLHACNGM